jgi:hypothetical protein
LLTNVTIAPSPSPGIVPLTAETAVSGVDK